ncbi:MAG: DUF6065 family protein [Alphaproteobacteria bacterium]
MQLIAHVVDGHRIDIRPAPVERDWMDATGSRFAYRCLPLNIANAHGWEILCPAGFTAIWNGAPALDAISVHPDPGTTAPALSHFGSGVLTFHVPCLFRTEPGYDLMVQGPMNRPKDAIAPLTGIVETDWAPFSFTMNWIFTRPRAVVRFEKGEPYAHLFPLRRGELENVEPRLALLSENPELKKAHEAWSASRSRFNQDLSKPDSQAQAEKWQKLYYRGVDTSGRRTGADDHRTRVKLKPFEPSKNERNER